MKFNNVENECVKTEDGRTVWLSRSMAVCSTVMVKQLDRTYVLMVKRGPGCPDEIGKWVLPCGYLDHNETLRMAAVRELYEETGVDVFAILGSSNTKKVFENFTDDNQMPWCINQSANGKQNITMHYGLFVEITEDMSLPSYSTANCEEGEVDELKWVDVTYLYRYDIGFSHEPRIKMFLNTIIAPRMTWTYKIVKFFKNIMT